jgi:hypothetical protein
VPNKIYSVTVTMPDLAAAHAEQEAKVESSNWASAIKLACDEISRRAHVKGKHIKSASIYFTVLESRNKDEAEHPRLRDKQAEPSQGILFDI